MEKVVMSLTLIAVGTATVHDLKKSKILNILTYPLMILGPIINTFSSGYLGFKDSLLGLFLPIIVLLIPFALGGIGAGDVKLIAGIGAMNGMDFVIFTLLYSSVFGGILGTIFQIRFLFLQKKISQKFPYGLAIFLGALTTYLVHS